eukprot:GEMP01082902.1.p1 GENE.GEMP01082902.1~~GEMP01082902.1.p1  ORF type:complete len:214 (+),score=30.31 GEMP01082902.1:76-717(+)
MMDGEFVVVNGKDAHPVDANGAKVDEGLLILRCKICVVGEPTVGKTSLCSTFQGGVQKFPKNYVMTSGSELMIKSVRIPDTNAMVEMLLIDCGGFAPQGSNSCALLKPHWINANAIMLVYAVDNPQSFQELTKWFDFVQESRSDSVVTGVVIANKTDLGQNGQADGPEFARSHGLEFFESSALKGDVDAPFHFLAEVFYQKYQARVDELQSSR